MSLRIIPVSQQARGNFNNGQIVENKPIGFPQEGGFVRPFSNLFYWARALGVVDSTIGLHPHQGFEIMSFVLSGDIRHYDTKTDVWKPLTAGDVQIIRAGSGIEHAEHLNKDSVIFQIWVDPDLSKTLSKPASYDDYTHSAFPVTQDGAAEKRMLIGEGSPLQLDTELEIARYKFNDHFELNKANDKILALYIIEGSGMLNGQTVEQDFFIISEEDNTLSFDPHDEMDVFVIEVPKELDYKSYAERAARFA
jgi:redox-sensitive bicupin YhaK (pirin superfamily)